MSDRKFRTWEVFATVSGNVTLVARFPYREREDANKLARGLRGGYVLSADASRPLLETEWLADAECIPDATPTQPVPVPVPVAVPSPTFRVWDDVNGRYVTTDGLAFSPVYVFPSEDDATQYARRLNEFGGYGGWASLRFHVR